MSKSYMERMDEMLSKVKLERAPTRTRVYLPLLPTARAKVQQLAAAVTELLPQRICWCGGMTITDCMHSAKHPEPQVVTT